MLQYCHPRRICTRIHTVWVVGQSRLLDADLGTLGYRYLVPRYHIALFDLTPMFYFAKCWSPLLHSPTNLRTTSLLLVEVSTPFCEEQLLRYLVLPFFFVKPELRKGVTQ